MTSERTLEQIDRDLNRERALLVYEARSGTASEGCIDTWRHIDDLLEQRLAAMVRQAPDAPPRSLDGPMVPR